uniref:Uncharacterized protein n=2 Tax=Avena sativa TaxID=4498 RepID=A0ACD6AIC6_AVESA
MNPAPSMDSAGSEIRLYRLSGGALVEVARLSALAPPRAVEGDLRAADGDGDGADAGTGAGLFVALVQGESVVDVARLVFRGGEPSDADGGQDSYSSNPSSSDDTAVSASTTDGVLLEVNSKYTDELLGNLSFGGGGLLVSSQDDQWINQSNWEGEGKEEEWEGDYEGYLSDEMRGSSDLLISASEQPASSFWSSRNDDDSSSDDGQHDQDQEDPKNCDEHWSNTSLSHLSASLFWSEKDDSSNSEQDQEHDNETDNKAHQSIQISLRLWPAQEHAVIKIFRGGNWVLTKDYILSWMKPEDVRTEYNLQVEFGGSFADVLGFRNNDCTMDFEVRMDCTPMLKNLVTLLKPSICNFQIIKKVGKFS